MTTKLYIRAERRRVYNSDVYYPIDKTKESNGYILLYTSKRSTCEYSFCLKGWNKLRLPVPEFTFKGNSRLSSNIVTLEINIKEIKNDRTRGRKRAAVRNTRRNGRIRKVGAGS